jgi:hypothetical protein
MCYDKRLTVFGSDISKFHSQVDLVMKFIHVLQNEQVVLLKPLSSQGTCSRPGSVESNGVMGSSSLPGGSTASPAAQPPSQPQGDQTLRPTSAFVHMFSSDSGVNDHDARRPWIHKMDFPRFDGSDVRIWLDKCSGYFQLYSVPHDFRVTAASLHMLD